MRIHSDKLTHADLADARRIARVYDADGSEHGSHKRARAFNVLLRGESRRRPNGGSYGADGSDYAATWDQWGVFLAVLFARDPELVTPYYADEVDFHTSTASRFLPRYVDNGDDTRTLTYWPADAHGDHTWSFDTTRGHHCTKCSARQVR